MASGGLKSEGLQPAVYQKEEQSKWQIQWQVQIAEEKADEGSAAIEINLITKMEFSSPINNEPVSPIKIFAG